MTSVASHQIWLISTKRRGTNDQRAMQFDQMHTTPTVALLFFTLVQKRRQSATDLNVAQCEIQPAHQVAAAYA